MATCQQQDRATIGRLTEIAYMMAKTALPFTVFQHIAALEKRHGVALGVTYLNEKGCVELTSCVGESLEDELKATLAETRYFSILSDGSTDAGVIEQELFYVLYVGSDGHIGQSYLKMASVSDGTAEGLTILLLDTVAAAGLDDTSKHTMVGFGADGASVNMGRKKGVAARLRVDKPWLVTVHCFNHRLELAVKDAFAGSYYTELFKIFTQIYYLYNNSPNRLRELAALAAAMEAHVVKPRKAHGTRWVQHKVAAATAILRSYDVLTAHLESMSADPTHDQAKAKGYLTKLTTFKFVVHLLFIVDLLQPFSKLSLAWQKDATEIPHMLAAERAMKAALARLRVAEDDETALSKLVEMGSSGTASYKGVSLTRVEQGTSFFTSRRTGYVDKVAECCEHRFCLDDSSDTFNAASILDTNMWPDEVEQLRAYGNEKVSFAADHFASILECDKDELLQEWRELKQFISANMKGQQPSGIWAKVHAHYSERYKSIARLINILRVLPFSNALVERCFSTMRKIKTDWRASLNTSTLDILIRIKKMGPPVDVFAPTKAVDVFFGRKPRRTGVQPYGPRQRDDGDGREHVAKSARVE